MVEGRGRRKCSVGFVEVGGGADVFSKSWEMAEVFSRS